MYGSGILRGLGVTLKHFVNSYIEDIKWNFQRHVPDAAFPERQGLNARGIFTVEYPEEKLAMPERFRFIPFLVVENYDHPERPGHDWCTSCGICAKVCPPQCIWIVRGSNPETGRPVPEPDEFYIDIDICMNCGFCAEFCPFDAIKMDHDYELAKEGDPAAGSLFYERTSSHIFDKKKLSKEFRYWQSIAPTRAEAEANERGGWEHKDVLKQREREAKQREKEAAAAKKAAAEDKGDAE